jgi:hypothetical protein
MMILLDKSPRQIAEYRQRYGVDFGQLRTPLTEYGRAEGVPYAVDNGCYKGFARRGWERLVGLAEIDRPLFVCLPDIVGDASRTIELFHHFKLDTNEVPRALVLQDGIERTTIPWADIAAVFIGGSDQFKYSREAIAAAKTARILGKWVHVGRVNTAKRVDNWLEYADSCDGSGLSMYDHMLEDVIHAIAGTHPQGDLIR